MRKLSILLAGFGTLALATAVSAAPTVSLTWTGTTGDGATGGSSIDAAAGDILTLKIFVSNSTPSVGISFAGISLHYSADLFGLAAVECPTAGTSPPGGNLFGAGSTCTPTGFTAPFMAPFAAGVTINNASAPRSMSSFDAGAPAPQFTTGTIELGAARFRVDGGSSSVTTFYVPGLDSVNDGQFNVFFPAASASVNVIPEPTTAALLGIGLLGLSLAGRRKA